MFSKRICVFHGLMYVWLNNLLFILCVLLFFIRFILKIKHIVAVRLRWKQILTFRPWREHNSLLIVKHYCQKTLCSTTFERFGDESWLVSYTWSHLKVCYCRRIACHLDFRIGILLFWIFCGSKMPALIAMFRPTSLITFETFVQTLIVKVMLKKLVISLRGSSLSLLCSYFSESRRLHAFAVRNNRSIRVIRVASAALASLITHYY